MAFRSFEDLEVWKKSCALAVLVYKAPRGATDFALKDQMQRAAVSIASNIAEGHERGGRDFVRFLRVAGGSAAELRTQLYIARKLDIISSKTFDCLLPELRQISKMLTGLRKALIPEPRKPKTKD